MYLFRTLQKYQFTTIISVYAVTLMADPTIEEAIYSKLKVPPLGSGQKGQAHHYGQLERQEEVDASRVGTVEFVTLLNLEGHNNCISDVLWYHFTLSAGSEQLN